MRGPKRPRLKPPKQLAGSKRKRKRITLQTRLNDFFQTASSEDSPSPFMSDAIKLCSWNHRKGFELAKADLYEICENHHPDILFLQETGKILKDIAIAGYEGWIHAEQSNGGGGVAILWRKGLKVCKSPRDLLIEKKASKYGLDVLSCTFDGISLVNIYLNPSTPA
jgi:hypothetical protein